MSTILPQPIGFRAIVVGSYSDDSTRIIPVTVRSITGEYFLFPNQPGGIGSLMTDDGFVTVGLNGTEKDPVTADQWIVTIDRGYSYGDSQPDEYPIPAEGGLLLNCSSASVGVEAFLYGRALSQVVGDGRE